MVRNLNFHPLEVASRYRDPQLQVAENYLYLFNLRQKIANVNVETHTLFPITAIWSADKMN